jgi:EAL domain-containing protein (putative c-di-GMP-specific phosphodiesterase class I)/CheY-like chemotaxis protein
MAQMASEGRNEKHAPAPVLVVDDEEAIRFLVAFNLTDAGIEVVEASSGEQALDLIRQGTFSAVVLDNRMPGMSGVELIRLLRSDRASRTLPVILVTAADQVDDRVAGLQAGANDYLTKPFEPSELVARVRALVRGREAWLDVVESHLRDRAAIAATLARLDPTDPPEETATVLCREIRQLEGVAGAAVLSLRDFGRAAVTLADDGLESWAVATGAPVPEGLAHYLGERARHGPWLEPADDFPGPLACAPIIRGEAVGVLLLRPTSLRHGEQVLATAIDFAAIASGLLGRALSEGDSRQARQGSLRSLLDLGQYRPVFQPIIDLATRATIGFEALTRFDDGMRPDLRFGEARILGLGIDLELATLDRALVAGRRLPEGTWLSVNVSPDLVLTPGALQDALTKADRPVILELTEHDPVDDYRALRAALDGLGSHLQLSVDDAGSGFASLRHVLVLRPAFMKLDQTWVTGVHDDPARQALIAGLVHFAESTGCQLIAEGIESAADLDTLSGLEVELGQGFYFGHPSPAREWLTVIED